VAGTKEEDNGAHKEDSIWTFAFVFILILLFHWPAAVFTTNFAGNSKTIFHPGDNVRYHVTFDLDVAEKTRVFARGTARGQRIKPGGYEGLFKTELEKQGKQL
jgi:hypothetical protein